MTKAVGCVGAALALAACTPTLEKPLASKVVEIPVTTTSDKARQLFDEGQYLLDVGRGIDANKKFRAAIAEDPAFAYAYLNLSNSALSFKEFKEALDQASAKLEGKSEGERLLVEINKTFLNNDSDRGLKLAQELVQKYPQSPRAHLALAGIHTTRNETQPARQSLDKAKELEPGSVAAVVTLGNSFLFNEPRDFSQAETYTRRFIELKPNEAKAYEALGDVKRAEKELPSALEAYTQATEKDPNLAAAQVKKGHVNSFLGNFKQATESYDAAIQSAEPEAKASYANYRAFTQIHAGKIPAALEELKNVADSVEKLGTPADQVKGIKVFTFNNQATTALHHGKLSEAEKAVAARNALQREIGQEMGTEDAKRLLEADCLMWDGLLAAHQGKYDLAKQKAEENAKLLENDQNPRKMEASHWVLGLAHLRKGDNAKAVEHLRQADHKNDMYIRYHLALAEEGAGNTGEAKRLFQEVADWNFNSVGFALVRADAAKRAGQ